MTTMNELSHRVMFSVKMVQTAQLSVIWIMNAPMSELHKPSGKAVGVYLAFSRDATSGSVKAEGENHRHWNIECFIAVQEVS